MTDLTLHEDQNDWSAHNEISEWSTDQMDTFIHYYETLIEKVEAFINSNDKIYAYLTNDGYYHIRNIMIEDGSFEIALEEARGCSCCRREESVTSLPIEWFTEGKWKEYFAKEDERKAEEERKEQREKDAAAETKRIAKEAKDKAEYERLKEKFK
ncbi:MAG: hypothetical protein DRI24_24010 [Deltaproteobacteria bacterium]|nr:MAG: hypothetical protein DRI24_24010 [Deltaproteobacteria bacterium]